METTTSQSVSQTLAAEAPQSKGEMVATGGAKLRLLYPKKFGESANIDIGTWQVLVDAVWPSAQTVESVCLAVNYCRSRNLDPLKRPVHIVPVYSKKLRKYVETIWPGISELRTTAHRTGVYAGKDGAIYGPDKTRKFHGPQSDDDDDDNRGGKRTGPVEVELTFPEWCQITVYRVVQGMRCAFVGPRVYWEEAYATRSYRSELPNDMWEDRRSGQLEKCAEAAALRAAFPEELGNQYTAEEMHGRVIDDVQPSVAEPVIGEAVPPRPKRSEFERAETRIEKEPTKLQPQEGKKAPPPVPLPPQAPEAQQANAPPSAIQDAEYEEVQSEAALQTDEPTVSVAAELESEYHDALKELAECQAIGKVTDLRERVMPIISTREREREWVKACEDRQQQILEASRKARKGK